jgi:hypothetical protein
MSTFNGIPSQHDRAHFVLTLAMHAPNSHLSQRDGLVSSVHGCRNVFFGRTERFGKVGTQIDLQFRQPILVVVQTQRHTTREPLLVVVTHDRFRNLDLFVAR